MTLSDAVFHLVSMQCREEREASTLLEKAESRGFSSATRRTLAFRAEQHEQQAEALVMAIAALVDLPQ